MSDVLVVDNNESIRKMYRAGLTGFGYRVAEADSHSNAQALLTSGEVVPHVVIMDLNRNQADGVEFITFLRKTPSFHDIKIIVATADSYTSEQKNELNVDAVMIKPIDLSRLVKTVYLYRRPESSTS